MCWSGNSCRPGARSVFLNWRLCAGAGGGGGEGDPFELFVQIKSNQIKSSDAAQLCNFFARDFVSRVELALLMDSVGLSLFSSPVMRFQMAVSHCRGWGWASPSKRSTSSRCPSLSNNKQRVVNRRRENQVTHREVGVPILSNIISSPWLLTDHVDTSKAQERPRSSFMQLLVQSHNPTCDNGNWREESSF